MDLGKYTAMFYLKFLDKKQKFISLGNYFSTDFKDETVVP
jgi:hypothetical protein